jgi:cellobiose-specific phosphotransferase system component IIA
MAKKPATKKTSSSRTASKSAKKPLTKTVNKGYRELKDYPALAMYVNAGGADTGPAKAALKKAKKGGAEKTAAKLTKANASIGSKKQVKNQILNDLSKTGMRAKIIDMNAKKTDSSAAARRLDRILTKIEKKNKK